MIFMHRGGRREWNLFYRFGGTNENLGNPQENWPSLGGLAAFVPIRQSCMVNYQIGLAR
jgi:hypothetical protein